MTRTVKYVPYQRDLAWRVAAARTKGPLVALLGGDRQLVALSYTPVTLADLKLAPHPGGVHHVGLVSYADPALTRVFAVDQALIVDHKSGQAYLTGGAALPETAIVPDQAPDLDLYPDTSAAAYLRQVASALNDIRDGRFYQINLLRYFKVGASVERSWLLARLCKVGGPMAALIDSPELTLASFSPERFISVEPVPGGLKASAYPIKGTAARVAGVEADRRAAAGLAESAKDRAELSMIVDLMRNDLRRVGLSGTVAVTNRGTVVTHKHVHHLEARVDVMLDPAMDVAGLIAAVCPAGSITGAPKIEVMRAIDAYEGRSRRYFMGNLFWLDGTTGVFDSSVLIRTLVREGAEGGYAYAAGSGIVTLSDPETERQEIAAKCRVIGRVLEE